MLHFAGGSKYSFNSFKPFLREHFEIHALELSGRGERTQEPLVEDIYQARDDLFAQMEPHLESEYVIYGHSLGGLLAYKLALLIEQKGLRGASKVVVSGRAVPTKRPDKIRYNLPKEAFIQTLKELNGTPKEILEHPELFEFFEPILRADFALVDRYHFNTTGRLKTPLSLLYGLEETFSLEEAQAWQAFSTHPMKFHTFSGNHFFIYEHIQEVCRVICED